jgi:hypothetical protein
LAQLVQSPTVIVFFYANGGKPLNHLPLILGAIGFGVIVGVPAAQSSDDTNATTSGII